jgi:zinc protease
MSGKDSTETKSESGVDSLSFKAKKKVFSNGLTAIVVENKKLPLFSYYTYYKVGGKHEKDGITGASHYLEHMMFKGAKKYGPGMFDKIVEGNGGSNNAYTSNDLTVYYENLPSEHLNKIIDVEADRMQNLALEKESFEKERNVVLEERKMRYENSDRGKIYLTMMKKMFEGTPYGTSVIGKIKDLKSVTRDQMYDYFKKFYAPNNAVIVIVGDVDQDDVFDELEKRFGDMPKSTGLEAYKDSINSKKDFEFKGKYNGKSYKLKGTSPNPSFFLAFKGIKIGPRMAYVLDILSSVLGDGGSSILTKKYVLNKKPVLSKAHAGNYTLQDSGVFFVGGELIRGANLSWIQKDLYKKLKDSCQSDINERSVQRIKNQYLVQMLSGLETNAGVASFLGNREIYYGDYNFYKKELDIYNSVTVDELKSACSQYLTKKNSIFLSIWNKN